MATENPTGGGGTVALDLIDRQRRFLRRALGDCRLGREDDLEAHPNDPEAGKWRADAEAYGRILGRPVAMDQLASTFRRPPNRLACSSPRPHRD